MREKRLQRTLSAILSVTLLSLLTISVVAVYFTVQPAFQELEQKAADTNFLRAQRTIASDLRVLRQVTADWAPWDDTYAFIRGEDDSYVETNIDLDTLTNLDLNLLVMFDSDAKVVWGGVSSATSDELMSLDDGFLEALPVSTLTTHAVPDSMISGMVATPMGPMFVATAPIVRNDYSGPIVGTMLIGSLIDDGKVAKYRLNTEVEMDLTEFAKLSPQQQSTYREALVDDVTLRSESSSKIHEISLLRDLLGEPLLILRVATDRDISALGSSTLTVVVGSLALVNQLRDGNFVVVLAQSGCSPACRSDQTDEARV